MGAGVPERASRPAGPAVSARAGNAASAGTEPIVPTGRPLTPGEALMKLFLDNADNGRNAANDELVAALRQRAREVQALADPPLPPHPAQRRDREGSRP